jgi:hypothetical protein
MYDLESLAKHLREAGLGAGRAKMLSPSPHLPPSGPIAGPSAGYAPAQPLTLERGKNPFSGAAYKAGFADFPNAPIQPRTSTSSLTSAPFGAGYEGRTGKIPLSVPNQTLQANALRAGGNNGKG